MDNIKLFESFFSEEDSNIYEAEYTKEKELVKAIVKTWVNDYVIPMIDFHWPQSGNNMVYQKDPKMKALVSKAKAWLGKSSGIPRKSSINDEIVGTYTNLSIVYINLYRSKELAAVNKGNWPLTASFYEDFPRQIRST